MRIVPRAILAVGALVFVTGCGPTYYRVTDPTTSRIYYTTELKDKGAGSVQLKDAGTGKIVTLQSSEIQQVMKEEYETGKVRSTLPTPVAPAPVPQSSVPPTPAPGGTAAPRY